MSRLNPKRVEAALRSIVADMDYDLYKELASDEETGENHFPEYVADFIKIYEQDK